MSAEQTARLLVRLYPKRWRRRYGVELQSLILEMSGGQSVSWRVRLDVAIAAAREQIRFLARGDAPGPAGRTHAALSVVLWGWMLVVLGGAGVAKTAEHWQAWVPAPSRAFPTGAYVALLVAAVIAGAATVIGIALALPAARRQVQRDGWQSIRRPLLAMACLSLALVLGTVGLAGWAHELTSPQRNGNDLAYLVAFAGWSLLVAAWLAGWTFVAARLARRISLPRAVLRLEVRLATIASVAMVAIPAATIAWWIAVGVTAPSFFGGPRDGSIAPPVTPMLVASMILMIAGALLSAAGTWRALRTLPGAELPPAS